METITHPFESVRKAAQCFAFVSVVAVLILGSTGCSVFEQENQPETDTLFRAEVSLRSLLINGQVHFEIEDADAPLVRDSFRYMYIITEAGFYIVSANAFPNAEIGGVFGRNKLTFEVDDQRVELTSFTPILGERTIPAHVRFDRVTKKKTGDRFKFIAFVDDPGGLEKLEKITGESLR